MKKGYDLAAATSNLNEALAVARSFAMEEGCEVVVGWNWDIAMASAGEYSEEAIAGMTAVGFEPVAIVSRYETNYIEKFLDIDDDVKAWEEFGPLSDWS